MKRAMLLMLVAVLVLLPAMVNGQPVTQTPASEVRTGYINGALAYLGKIGGSEAYSLFGAYGPNVQQFWDDFTVGPPQFTVYTVDSAGYGGAGDANTADLAQAIYTFMTTYDNGWSLGGWRQTRVEAGSGDSRAWLADSTKAGTIGGVLWLDPAANENDGVMIQTHQGAFGLDVSNSILYFGARVQVDDSVSQSDWFVGLADTSGLAAGLSCDTTQDDGIGFASFDGQTDVEFLTKKNSTSAHTTGGTVTAATWVLLEFWYDGRLATPKASFYVNGVYTGAHTTYIPNDVPLAVNLSYRNGAATMDHEGLFVDWVHVVQFNP